MIFLGVVLNQMGISSRVSEVPSNPTWKSFSDDATHPPSLILIRACSILCSNTFCSVFELSSSFCLEEGSVLYTGDSDVIFLSGFGVSAKIATQEVFLKCPLCGALFLGLWNCSVRGQSREDEYESISDPQPSPSLFQTCHSSYLIKKSVCWC